ncbi:MAG: aldehyde ferredoxin oxidoreductase family protein [Candidatus Thorarchaeota archaeon]|nr:aldehyde ferredoxin oxidoreductase family protein [Candidatus Thorarchaeota archaeon]
MIHGVGGKVIWVDLTKGKIEKRPIEKKLVEKYLLGAGYLSKVLFDSIPVDIDPLSPENVLGFATGLLTASMFPQSSRHVVAALSPLTDVWGESHAAGFWGPELKLAGYDAIFFTGASRNPVYLNINDSTVELLSADDVWGRDVFETDDILRERHGRRARLIYIGQAGENLVRFAAVMNDRDRASARSGLGAVMGSKKLKAICVRGTGKIEVADPKKYMDTMDEFYRRMLANPFTPGRAKYGTTNLLEMMQHIGRLPSYNMRQGVFEGYEKISGETITEKYLVKPRSDWCCLQRCARYTSVKEGPYKYIGGSPEFETQSSLGSRCGNDNLESVLFGHHLANQYGMDTISLGGTISWAMEAWDEGLLTADDTDGIDLSWGNHESIVKLIKMIAFREGFGDLLAEGSARAAEKIGRGTEKFVMTVKKQEIAGQEPRAQKSMGLAAVTAARGADHLYAFPVLDEAGFDDEIRERFGEEYLPEMADRLNPKYKGIMVKECEDFMVVVESLGLCKYGTQIPPEFYYEDVALALKVHNGLEFTRADLQTIGERIVNLNRLFNAKRGVTRADDNLPDRLTKEGAPLGPAKGEVVELDQMLDEYYLKRGWDNETGIPYASTLQRLGLVEEASGMEIPD